MQLGPVLPRDRQPRRPRRVLAAGLRPGRARPQVRLWVDDARALAWMAPQGAPGRAGAGLDRAAAGATAVGDVVVEAFGCDPPTPSCRRWRAAPAPVWINLEYLSAEAYVERSHGLPSPSGPRADQVVLLPRLHAATGGLLREPGLMTRQAASTAPPGWHGARLGARPGERVVSLFCYAQPRLCRPGCRPGRRPTLLLATPGPLPATSCARWPLPPACGCSELPWLTQADYDRLLWPATWPWCAARTPSCAPCGPARCCGRSTRSTTARTPPSSTPGSTSAAGRRALALACAGARRRVVNRLERPGQPDAGTCPTWRPGAWQHRCWRDGLLAQDDLVTQLWPSPAADWRGNPARIAGFAQVATGTEYRPRRPSFAASSSSTLAGTPNGHHPTSPAGTTP
jgi:hypothetical protein